MNKSEMSQYMQEFTNEYGEILAIKANLAAINQLLIKKGKSEELFQEIQTKINTFKRSVQHEKQKQKNEKKQEK